MTGPLTDAESDLIATAVAEAESRTSGEIVCVVAGEVSAYREVPLAWAAGVAILVPPLAVLAGLDPLDLQETLLGWSAGHAAAADLGLAFTLYATAQAVLFVATALVVSIPAVRRRLTPCRLKEQRVHRAALEHFVGRGLHRSPDLKGVEIFASIQDRRIEIIADETVHAAMGQGAWDGVIRAAVDEMHAKGPAAGLALAVRLCGDLMAPHFPDDGGPNRAPDRPIVL